MKFIRFCSCTIFLATLSLTVEAGQLSYACHLDNDKESWDVNFAIDTGLGKVNNKAPKVFTLAEDKIYWENPATTQDKDGRAYPARIKTSIDRKSGKYLSALWADEGGKDPVFIGKAVGTCHLNK